MQTFSSTSVTPKDPWISHKSQGHAQTNDICVVAAGRAPMLPKYVPSKHDKEKASCPSVSNATGIAVADAECLGTNATVALRMVRQGYLSLA